MTRLRRFAFLLGSALLAPCATLSAQTAPDPPTFIPRTGRFGGITLPYREANIAGDGQERALVIYLHGGSSKGSDNEKPIAEPGVDSLARYLTTQGIAARLVVPQCPSDKSWGGMMNGVLRGLIASYADGTDPARIYIFGGSMGGTGTWSMLTAYPTLFAAAMPVAGDPSRAVPDSVAQTPFFTVMGTADAIMSIDKVTAFTGAVAALGGTFRFETVNGWTHEDTCERSYTTDRLSWVFSHTRALTPAAVTPITETAPVTARDLYCLDGRRLSEGQAATLRGLFIERLHHADGTVESHIVRH